MAIINLTPHDINVADADGNITKTYPASGDVARCATPVAVNADPIDDVPVVDVRAVPGPVVGLPDPVDGIVYIVSGIVASHPDVVGRCDVVGPGTGPDDNAVRNDKRQIIAVRRFRRSV